MIDRNYIDDHHFVARYLADQLPDAERADFEAYCLKHPELFQELEAAARFKVGFAKLHESGELRTLATPVAWYKRVPQLAALAATVALAVGIAFWMAPRSSASLMVASIEALADRSGTTPQVSGTYEIARARGMSSAVPIELPATFEVIELRLRPEFEAQPPRYRVRLSELGAGNSTREVAALSGLTSGDAGDVRVYLNSRRLMPGRYQIAIAGDGGTNSAERESRFILQMTSQPSKPGGASPPR